MSWLVYRIDADHTGVELDALLDPRATVISEHESIRDARQALADYRAKQAEEAEWLRAQRSLFEVGE